MGAHWLSPNRPSKSNLPKPSGQPVSKLTDYQALYCLSTPLALPSLTPPRNPPLAFPLSPVMAEASNPKKTLLTIVKIVLAVAILGYLFQRIQAEDGFDRLIKEQKRWPYLFAAQSLVLLAFSFSFIRWFLLVRGLDLKFRLRDAFRLGTLGYMLNQVSPGSVGGDLVKAVFIAREQPDRKTEAVATVLVDRVIGLYAMLLIASLALALAGDAFAEDPTLATLRGTIWAAAVCGTVGLAMVLSRWATGPKVKSFAEGLPAGHTLVRLIEAAEVYRSRRGYLFAGFGLALATHCLLIGAFWFISRGLPIDGPTFSQNASLVPIALVAGAVPLTPGGLGALEGGMEFLYTKVGAGKGDGTLVALAYRAMTYFFASVGAFYYFTARKKMDDLIHDAEILADETA